MRIAAAALALVVAALPMAATARGSHHGMGAVRHGHPINSWMGHHRPRLR